MKTVPKRPRGRPQEYDRNVALDRAMELFWHKGLSATSLDELADAMQMNRPSIYRAFGNKEAIYRNALRNFSEQALAAIDTMLNSDQPLKADLEAFFSGALQVYCGGDQPLGCFIACTAVTDVTVHPELQTDLLDIIRKIDDKLEIRCLHARDAGDLRVDIDPHFISQSIQGMLHTLATRARAGQPKHELEGLVAFFLEQMIK